MANEDLVCSEISVDGIKYQNGDIIVNDVLEGGENLTVGLIKTILVKSNTVSFVIKQFVAVKNSLGFFESKDVTAETLLVDQSNLADWKPLIMRGSETKFLFVLHHYISFDYS